VKAVVFYESADDEDTMKWLIPILKTFIPNGPGDPVPAPRPARPRDQSRCQTGERGAVDRARHPAPMRQAPAGQTPHRAPALGPVLSQR